MLLETFITAVNELIFSSKSLYYKILEKKLINPLLQAKNVLVNLKTFYNEKKILLILPLLVKYRFATDIKINVNIFNNVFAEKCAPLKNDSVLPTNQMILTK